MHACLQVISSGAKTVLPEAGQIIIGQGQFLSLGAGYKMQWNVRSETQQLQSLEVHCLR